jgi:hypothetical protein
LSFLNYLKLDTVKLNLLDVVFGVLKLWPNVAWIAFVLSSKKGVLFVCCDGSFLTVLLVITREFEWRALVPIFMGMTLEKPKSHSLTWQSESISILAGLMSL